ncbi:MAG TPA: glycosyltransferase, partial [Herpetosiphonaceae bacterium]
MRVALLTLGSRGDVQPFLALARALRAAGHEPVLAASAGFAPWIRSHGAGFAPISFDAERFFRQPALERAKGSRLRFLAAMRREIGGQMVLLLDEFWQACQGAELIIAPPPLAAAAYETLGAGPPLVAASPQPFLPTGAFPSFFLGAPIGFGRRANRLSHLALERGFWLCVRPWINRWRRERLGLPPASWSGAFEAMRRDRVPFLFAYSRHLLPPPADWQPWHTVTGYWFLDEEWEPPAALRAFLERGPPPVYVGFGS